VLKNTTRGLNRGAEKSRSRYQEHFASKERSTAMSSCHGDNVNKQSISRPGSKARKHKNFIKRNIENVGVLRDQAQQPKFTTKDRSLSRAEPRVNFASYIGINQEAEKTCDFGKAEDKPTVNHNIEFTLSQ
jgi:hypothetical protein